MFIDVMDAGLHRVLIPPHLSQVDLTSKLRLVIASIENNVAAQSKEITVCDIAN